MAWFYLILAGIFEIIWAVGLRYCDGLKINFALIIVTFATIWSIILLSLAMRVIPVGVSYAVWTGIGIAGVSLYGMFFLAEPVSLSKILFLIMILLGIVGLKFITD